MHDVLAYLLAHPALLVPTGGLVGVALKLFATTFLRPIGSAIARSVFLREQQHAQLIEQIAGLRTVMSRAALAPEQQGEQTREAIRRLEETVAAYRAELDNAVAALAGAAALRSTAGQLAHHEAMALGPHQEDSDAPDPGPDDPTTR